MRLSELDPSWYGDARDPSVFRLRFNCPHCREKDWLHIAVWQKQSVDRPHVIWQWNGEKDFDRVTITPSIRFFGHWHGYITNGEVSMLADEPSAPAAPTAPSPDAPPALPTPEAVDPAPPPVEPAPAPPLGRAKLDEHDLPVIHDNIGHVDMLASLRAIVEKVRKLAHPESPKA